MNKEDILAVIVSFNGMNKTLETCKRLIGDVGHVVIVDNASSPPSRRLLENYVHPKLSIHYLSANLGIGAALNIGLELARQRGFSWLLTMDQDSIVAPDFVNQFVDAIIRNPGEVCLTPAVIFNGTRPTQNQKDGPVDYAITSGNLVSVEVFARVGTYDADMFIDCIDFDFCLRVRKAGWNIFRVASAVLHHELGEQHQSPRLLGRFYAQHSPLRRYYMFRNYMYLLQRHSLSFPGFMLKSTVVHILLLLLVPIYDKHPRESFMFIACGIRDYCLQRTGRYEG